MTDSTLAPDLPRPAHARDRGPRDDTFYDLVEARLRRLVRDNPILGTALGLHALDDELGDGGREAVLAELEADRRHLAQVEALDPADLSATARFERDLELHNVRRAIFDADVLRIWERRSLALDTIGDGLFLLFARDHAPLAERLAAIAGRLEAIPEYLDQSRSRAVEPQVRMWQRVEIETAAEIPTFLDEIVAAADGAVDGPERRRLGRAADAAKVAVELYTTWLEGTLADGTDDWPIGRERHDALVAHRAFDGLDADEILELGWQKLAEEKAARIAAAREVDPDASEAEVVDRVKSDQPADFNAALTAYATAMHRARAHLIERDLVTVPADERIDVIETPEYLRNVIPFAAYFEPATFDRDPKGIYIVTPVGGRRPERDAGAQLRLDQQHQHPRGVSRPPPAARHGSASSIAHSPAGRRAGIHRGLGDVLGADDARARLRRRPALPGRHAYRRDLAGVPDHPGRADAPGRGHAR